MALVQCCSNGDTSNQCEEVNFDTYKIKTLELIVRKLVYSWLHPQWKKQRERRKNCVLAVVRRRQKFRLTTDPLPGGAGRPKFNQLEMGSLPLPRNRVWWRSMHATQTRTPTNTQTHIQDRLQYTAPLSWARSVTTSASNLSSVWLFYAFIVLHSVQSYWLQWRHWTKYQTVEIWSTDADTETRHAVNYVSAWRHGLRANR